MEDQSHRASPSKQLVCQRDTSSPRSQPNTSLHRCPSLDVDEAFSSMESSMSRLYIQDVPNSMEGPNHSYSSGVASYSMSHDIYSLPGSFGGYHTNHQNGPMSCEPPMCNQCRCGQRQTRMSPHHHHHHHHHPAWGSCPVLPPHDREHPCPFSEKQCFRQPPTRQSHSLPRDPWVQGVLSDGRLNGGAESLSSEQRNGLRSQLSTLFPQSTVEHVMNANPQVSDMLELITLIQSNRTSYMFL